MDSKACQSAIQRRLTLNPFPFGLSRKSKGLLASEINRIWQNHNIQVDMKIMYYELIRMLIDYERKNHPETYDATKTVGKIEGYQELTNKLQR